MPNSQFQKALSELRARVSNVVAQDAAETTVLTRALHDLDVLYAELEIQNQDLTETQLELERARENFRGIFEHAPVAILSVSASGVVLESNRAAEAVLGRTRESLVGKPFVVCLGDAQLDIFFQHLAATTRGAPRAPVALVTRLPSGEMRHVELSSSVLVGQGVKSLLCHLNDVTAKQQVEAAQQKLERRLHEAERLEAIGRVAANIAHDVNNILMSVVALGEFVKADCEGRPSENDMTSLLDAAWRGARLMRGLLGLSRPAAGPPKPMDLWVVLQRVHAMQKHKKPGVEVRLIPTTGSAWVSGHEDDLFQAFLNVTTNALEATDVGGEVVLEGTLAEDANRNPLARVRVRDNGAGMTPDQRLRAFEPLFTTKGDAGGSGLGLTLVFKTVRAHRGSIDVESTPAAGTTVSMDLPICPAPGAASLAPTARRPLPGTIILVDDEKLVRTATRRQLEAAGAKVLAYESALDALEDIRGGLTFDAAVVDVNMPACTGPEFVERLFELLGPRPVVFVTGASGELIPEALLTYECVRLVRKPWTRDQLFGTLHAVASARPEVNPS
ncbi:MAG: response regulator [Polyangiaceae bacterium]|nr:response regulator [Polyangiaceae bacterium]